jgi:hypothetical protein
MQLEHNGNIADRIMRWRANAYSWRMRGWSHAASSLDRRRGRRGAFASFWASSWGAPYRAREQVCDRAGGGGWCAVAIDEGGIVRTSRTQAGVSERFVKTNQSQGGRDFGRTNQSQG